MGRCRRVDENLFDGPAPIVGDKLTVTCRGLTFETKVIWGNWATKGDPSVVVPLRVAEV
jgi:hypothetical protein